MDYGPAPVLRPEVGNPPSYKKLNWLYFPNSYLFETQIKNITLSNMEH